MLLAVGWEFWKGSLKAKDGTEFRDDDGLKNLRQERQFLEFG